MSEHPHIPAPAPLVTDNEAALAEGQRFFEKMHTRRTIRDFTSEPVDRRLIDIALATAGTAPSGANQQPWHFVVISDRKVKRAIREAAEAEEREFYNRRASEAWLDALAPIGTDADKPFLEIAPYLIGVFVRKFHLDGSGERVKHYYPTESTGLATGLLISALHQMGLATLTHTPSPMGFMNDIMNRPASDRAFVLLVVGKAVRDAKVPDLQRKPLAEFVSEISAGTPTKSR
ncbi:MAG: nitroreductase family protein [Pseudomonadaceae bacterium]|nr:nitroreductase family protein [Pseudomonadaceae bacterium]